MTAPADLTVLLDQLDAARAKATPGPWLHRFHVGASGDVSIVVAEGYGFPAECADQNGDADAACIVAEHNAVPRLTAALRAVLALHVPWYEINGVRHDHTVTATCADFDRCDGDAEHECDDPDEHERLACNECRDVFEDIDGYLFWPCPTVTAIASAVAEEVADYPDPRPFNEVMAVAVAANEAAGIPDPEQPLPMNHTSDGTDESEEYDGW